MAADLRLAAKLICSDVQRQQRWEQVVLTRICLLFAMDEQQDDVSGARGSMRPKLLDAAVSLQTT